MTGMERKRWADLSTCRREAWRMRAGGGWQRPACPRMVSRAVTATRTRTRLPSAAAAGDRVSRFFPLPPELLCGAWGRTRRGSRSCCRKRGHSVPYVLGDLNLNRHTQHRLRGRFLPGKACSVETSLRYYLETGRAHLNIDAR